MATFTDMLDGYHRFKANSWIAQRTRFESLVDGQSPEVLIIACSDSRADPTQIFDTSPGEMFVVRNVAALVPPCTDKPGVYGVSAAVEFAVQMLGVKEIVVMGHGRCGGCNAALSQAMRDALPGEGGFIASWISLLDKARARVVAELGETTGRPAERAMEQAAVKVSLANLRTFPWIREKEASGALTLRGAIFAISDGVLHLLDEKTDRFLPYE
jgi:carbonic anhydrase